MSECCPTCGKILDEFSNDPLYESDDEIMRLRAELVSWNKHESRVQEAYDKTRTALLDATEERGWLADQCNVLHSHLNASPPLGMTGWLEAAIFARENRTGVPR